MKKLIFKTDRPGLRVSDVTFSNHGGFWGPVSVMSHLLIMEVGWGPMLVTLRFFNHGSLLRPCVCDITLFESKGVPLSLGVMERVATNLYSPKTYPPQIVPA